MSSSGGRVRRWILPAAALVGLGLVGSARAQTIINEQEPNNSPSTATIMPVTTATLVGTSDLLGDVDYWKTDLVAGNIIRIRVNGLTGDFTGRVELLSATLPTECDGGFNNDSLCTTNLDCQVQCLAGTCLGGPDDGAACTGTGAGSCVADDGVCDFAPVRGPIFQCEIDNALACDPAALACDAGFRQDAACTSDLDCIEQPTCEVEVPFCQVALDRCVGGIDALEMCVTDADCRATFCDTNNGSKCVGGLDNSLGCAVDADCRPFNVCQGGLNAGQKCTVDSECVPDSGTCSIFAGLAECADPTSGCSTSAEVRRPSVGTLPAPTLQTSFDASTPPGPGFIRFTNRNLDPTNPARPPYSLDVKQGRPEVEPNDDFAQAQTLGTDFPVLALQPSQTPDADFYTFDITEPVTAAISLDYPLADPLVLGFELLDVDGNVLASAVRTNISGSGAAKNPAVAAFLDTPGTYFVKVTKAALSVTAFVQDYSLFLKLFTGAFESEPNQSFNEAIPLDVTPGDVDGTAISGDLQVAQDVDLYKVRVPAGMTLIADLDAIDPVRVLDGVVSAFIQEDLGVSFASSDDSSFAPAGASFGLVNLDGYIRVVPPRGGDIVVGVADLFNRGGPIGFGYRIRLKVVDSLPQESEPNNTLGMATPLTSGVTVRGTIGAVGDVDLFTVSASAGESLLVNLNAFGIGSFLDARVIVRDPSQNVLTDQSTSAFSLDPFVLLRSLPSDGDYSIEVRLRPGTSGKGVSFYYELLATAEASLDQVVSNPDIDVSSRVDGFDLATLGRSFGTNAGDAAFVPEADLLPDSAIDGQDLAVLGNFFGSSLPASTPTSSLVADTVGDATGFFGPTSHPVDLIGIGTNVTATDLVLSAIFADVVDDASEVIVSIDADSSSLTGSLGTPDAYVVQNNLGSEIEMFMDRTGAHVFSVPDSRTDIFPAFQADVGDTLTEPFVRAPLAATLVATLPVTAAGNVVTTQVPLGLVGGGAAIDLAALAVAAADIEPTDRLPNVGKISFVPPFSVTAVSARQVLCSGLRTCSDDPAAVCTSSADCTAGATCTTVAPLCAEANVCSTDPLLACDPGDPAGSCGDPAAVCLAGDLCPVASVPCVDVDAPSSFVCSNQPATTCDPASFDPFLSCGDFTGKATCNNIALPSTRIVYMRTPAVAPIFTDFERGFEPVVMPGIGTIRGDTGNVDNNDSLDRIFPPGVKPPTVGKPRGKWFSRDILMNFGARSSIFDPHTADLPPPDIDMYYFVAAEGDHAVVDVTTADAGATFDSMIELFSTPLRLTVLDPSTPDSQVGFPESELALLASVDDKGPGDLDPR
ncbi:MAG: hypothetical protein ACE5IK_06505, partial [Acidobacteriota bacterium]